MVVRRGSFLAPLTPFDSEQLERFAPGKPIKAKLTQPRSVPHHRLYWAMLAKVCENLDNIPTETLHEVVKLRCGYATTVRTKSGPVTVPGSIAFEKMTQPEFREFFERAVAFVCEQIIPGLGRDRLKREVAEMLGEAA